MGQRETPGCDTGSPKPQPTPRGTLGLKWPLHVVLYLAQMGKTFILWGIIRPGKVDLGRGGSVHLEWSLEGPQHSQQQEHPALY